MRSISSVQNTVISKIQIPCKLLVGFLCVCMISIAALFVFGPVSKAYGDQELQAATTDISGLTNLDSQATELFPAAVDTVKIYRLYNPSSGEHLFTRDENEKKTLTKILWNDEGISWYAPATSKTPVYRVFNPKSGEHHYTIDVNERNTLQRLGWKNEGIVFYSDDSKTTPIYRRFNPSASVSAHHYTTSRFEARSLIRHRWNDEGVGWYAVSAPSTDTQDSSLDGVDVYRLLNRSTGEHLLTTSVAERDNLIRNRWQYEGVAWVAPKNSSIPIYRLYGGGEHLYTADANEINSLKRAGWKQEGIAFYSDDQKTLQVRRLFNPNVNPRALHNNLGAHHFTMDATECNTLKKAKWRDEGAAWYAIGKGESVASNLPDPNQLLKRLRLTTSFDRQFYHGYKGSEWQGYIVLHDTEGDGPPINVVNWWRVSGNKVAAHFVVGKDGSIVQCVPMDQIAHHAGFGNTGHNRRYGTTDESRDDRVGTVPIGPQARDYGMNSYSIGIEMVHVGGSGGYPAAQLQALDNLIAYIDAYYGFESPIIDHKAWRSGNSDTSPEFAGYLRNYQRYRHH